MIHDKLLTPRGSNSDSSEPKSDVLPITPEVNLLLDDLKGFEPLNLSVSPSKGDALTILPQVSGEIFGLIMATLELLNLDMNKSHKPSISYRTSLSRRDSNPYSSPSEGVMLPLHYETIYIFGGKYRKTVHTAKYIFTLFYLISNHLELGHSFLFFYFPYHLLSNMFQIVNFVHPND